MSGCSASSAGLSEYFCPQVGRGCCLLSAGGGWVDMLIVRRAFFWGDPLSGFSVVLVSFGRVLVVRGMGRLGWIF